MQSTGKLCGLMVCEIELRGRKWRLTERPDGLYIQSVFDHGTQVVEYKILKPRVDANWRILNETFINCGPGGEEEYRSPPGKFGTTLPDDSSEALDRLVKTYRRGNCREQKSPLGAKGSGLSDVAAD